MKNEFHIKRRIFIGFILLGIILIAYCIGVNCAYASIGEVGTPVLVGDSSYSAGGDYTVGAQYSRLGYELYNDYYMKVMYHPSAEPFCQFVYTNDGVSYSTAVTGIYGQGDLDQSWNDICYNEEENYMYMMRSRAGGSYDDLFYMGYNVSDGTFTQDKFIYLSSNYYQSGGQGSIVILNGKPVLFCWGYFNDGLGSTRDIRAYFADSARPTGAGSFSMVYINTNAFYGNSDNILTHCHVINSTTILVLMERTNTDDKIYGVYVDSSGFGTPFEITSESNDVLTDSNSKYIPVISTISEYTLNNTEYAENIGIVWRNNTGFVKFAIWDVEDESLSEAEVVADDSDALYNPSLTSIAKDEDTYFIGYVGNRNATYCDYFIVERNPEGEYISNLIYDDLPQSTSLIGSFCMSKVVVGGWLFVQYMDGNRDVYCFTVEAEGESSESESEGGSGDYAWDYIFNDIKYLLLLIALLIIAGVAFYIKSGWRY